MTWGVWGLRRPVQAALASLMVAALTSCATGPGDFVREGEQYLQSDEMARAAGYRLLGARCEAPSSVIIGTVYFCTATDERGYAWRFELEITGPRELTVQDVSPAPGTTWNN
jgi:hypothetical protein